MSRVLTGQSGVQVVQALRAAPRDLEFAHRGDRRFGEVTCLTSVPFRGDRSRESSRTGHWPRVTNLRPFFGAESGLLKRIARSRSLCAAHKFQRRRKTLLYNKMQVSRFDHARVRKKCKRVSGICKISGNCAESNHRLRVTWPELIIVSRVIRMRKRSEIF